jgi:ADP-heptose:LPS heptosyltransferase
LLASNPAQRLVATASSSPREQERLQALACAVANDRLTALHSLSIAELAAVLQRCRLHVGADSGVLHLAVLVGLPTVALFRDYFDAASWTPSGPTHRVFRAPCVCVNRREQPCAPAQHADCLARVTVNDVQAAVHALLREFAATPANNKLA